MITRNGKQKIVHGSLPLCFRLLNSEIGNDPRTNALPIIEAGEVFVSLTRR